MNIFTGITYPPAVILTPESDKVGSKIIIDGAYCGAEKIQVAKIATTMPFVSAAGGMNLKTFGNNAIFGKSFTGRMGMARINPGLSTQGSCEYNHLENI